MSNNKQAHPQPGISLGDIYYTIFRHKWKIVLMSLAGLVAAWAIHRFDPPLYQSQAELWIKYVETSQPQFTGDGQRVIVPDSSGEDVINSEIRILTSLNVAEEAASNMGPATVLAKLGGPASEGRAAGFICGNLSAAPADGHGNVIIVTFKHPDPHIVQPLLQSIIDAYLQEHFEIHSASGQFEDNLTMERAELSVQLNATEQQLADLENRYNIINLTDSQKELTAQLASVREAILDATAQLSADEATMKVSGGRQSLELVATNRLPVVIPQSELDAYANACASLDTFRKKEQDYLTQGFTRNNTMLEQVEEQITSAEKERDSLQKQYPQIAGVAPLAATAGSTTTATVMDPQMQLDEIVSLKAKIQSWQTQLKQLETQATNLNNLAPTISQLQQTESILEANYQTLSVSLEKSHINEALDPRQTPNIRSVQTPSPPAQDWKKTEKLMAMAVVGGIFGGLVWAFFIEMVLDRSVKRPVEIERGLKLPLFLSIPDINRNGYARLARKSERLQLPSSGGTQGGEAKKNDGSSAVKGGKSQVVSFEQSSPLQTFCHALRNRLILYFEVKNFTHKPKLVAVTGAGRGTGVSTIASGLAASLSETGDGNVLLVDMNIENGSAQQFYKGKVCCGLDTVLVSETKKDALMQENLYVVNGNSNGDGLPSAFPKRFTALVPKLKASEYDYIIFDMPAVSPTSVTAHMARFMDITLLVVESEKTGRDIVEQANALLTEVGASVGVVLNKTRQYVPKQLDQESLGDR